MHERRREGPRAGHLEGAFALLTALALMPAAAAHAGTFGVPGNLAPTGAACTGVNLPAGEGCTAASTNPPGYFILDSTNTAAAAGDTVHQIRFFVEVTGTTLDVRVFDAGSNSALDSGTTITSTNYTLVNPSGAVVQTVAVGADTAATDDRLARLTCNGGWENLNVATQHYFGLTGCTNGATIAPGLYQLVVGINDTGSNEYNAFGIDVRDGAGNPYNVYVTQARRLSYNGVSLARGPAGNRTLVTATVAGGHALQVGDIVRVSGTGNANLNGTWVVVAVLSATQFQIRVATDPGTGGPFTGTVAHDDSGLVVGALNSGTATPYANITPPITLYPYVNRGCTAQTSNFDMDSAGVDVSTPVQNGQGSYATLTDAVGVTAPSLTMSADAGHSEDGITIAPTGSTNLDVRDYGMYTLANGPGSQQNLVDWRVADWQGWNDNPAGLPPDPVSAIRTYLPNAACPVYGTCPAASDPPSEPVLTASARVCTAAGCTTPGGSNPPVIGQTTGFQMLAVLSNPGPAAITNAHVYGGATSSQVTYQGNPVCYLDGTALPAAQCTFTQAAVGTAGPFSVDALYSQALAVGHWFGLSYEVQLTSSGLDNLTAAPGETNTVRATYTASGTGTARAESLGPVCQVPVNIGDISVTKTVTPPTVQPGSLLTYTITVKSAGNATNPYWTDTLPPGTLFQSLTNPDPANWTCTTPALGANGTVACNAASLASGASRSFTVVVLVSPAYDPGSLSNTAVAGAGGDTTLVNDSATAPVTVVPLPTLRVSKSASVSTAVVAPTATTFTYTVVVTNYGSASATGVVMTDTLPVAQVTYVSVAPTAGCIWASPTLTCTTATLAAGASVTRTITVTAAAAGTAVNTATVTSTAPGGSATSLPTRTRVLAAAPATPTCATPGRDGALTVSGAVAPNTYYPGTGNPAIGATTIALGAASGTTPIASGDLLMVIQMQDVLVNATNDATYGENNGTGRGSTTQNSIGLYEFVRATSALALAGGNLTIATGLANAYHTAAVGAGYGQRRFQVIRVPQYTSVSFGSGSSYGTLTALPWNGTSGGILALDVSGTLTLGTDPVLSVASLVNDYPTANNVVTVTTAQAHNYNTGDLVTIAGADQAPYNGTFVITRTGTNTFTYTVVDQHADTRAPAYPTSPSTGTITATRYPVNASGRGFRGGGGRALAGAAGLAYTDYRTPAATAANGSKGEGIAGTPQYVLNPSTVTNVINTGVDGYPNGSSGRGAPGNAGGGSTDGDPDNNDQNSGGGGGGNGGIGGLGGNSWYSNYTNGGIGGDSFAASATAMVMGGGGGAGTRNNSFLSASSGGAGGGIVFIRAGAVAGTGTVVSDGAQGVTPENDGGGGGGAGGTILIAAASGGLGGVTARARGARGTDAWPTIVPSATFPNERHGPGGGGGGGWVLTTSTPGAVDVSGGAPGITTTLLDTYGAAPGAPGLSATIAWSAVPGVDGGADCSADVSIVKTAALVSTTSLVYTLEVTNNGFADAAAVTVSDPLPTGTAYVSAVTTLGTCSYAATPPTVTCTLGTLASGATAGITVTVTPPAAGTITNTATASSSTTPDPDTSNNTSSAAVTVSPQTDLGVTITAPADPVLAGQTASYTIGVTNAGPSPAPGAALTIPIPANTTYQSIAAPTGWSCTSPAVGSGPPAQIVCNPTGGTAPYPTNVSFTLVLGIPAGTTAGTVITTTASVSTTGYDTNPANDAASASNTVGPVPQLLTRAAIAGLRVDRGGLVEFATRLQHRTVSFEVYATDDPRGLRGLSRLTESPILATRPDATLPTIYELRTRPIHERYLVIEERDARGRLRAMGPFEVGSPHLRRAFELVDVRVASQPEVPTADAGGHSRSRWLAPREAAAEAQTRVRTPFVAGRGRGSWEPPRRPPSAAAGVRVRTSGSGVVTVTRADLEAAGLPPRQPLQSLKLSNLGREVPFAIVGGAAGDGLRFVATPLSTPYTGQNAYVVTWNGRLPRPAVALTTPERPPASGFVRVRKDTLYLQTAPLDQPPWFWDALTGDGTPWPSADMLTAFPGLNAFDVPGLMPGQGEVPLHLVLWTDVAGRHNLRAWINGVMVAEWSGSGAGEIDLDGTIPGSALASQGNLLTLTYSGVPDSVDEVAYLGLRWLDVGAALDPGRSAAVVASVQPLATALDLGQVEYLIVTHAAFAAQAARIAQLKRAEGLQTAVVDVEDAYDAFSGGVVEAEAVHQIVRQAARGGRLRFVLLVGADTFDPQDFMGTGAVSYVPSLMGWDGEFGRVPSENRYADLDGDGTPEVAIGRLPAHDVAEADALVDKIAGQAAVLRQAARRQLFAVDTDPLFGSEARGVAGLFPRAVPSWADLSGGWQPARDALFQAWSGGVALTSYFGHGGPQQWADESLLDVADGASVGGPPSVFLTWTCLTQFYQFLWGPSVNEALLLRPGTGALASFGPAGIADVSLQATLYGELYRAMQTPGVSLGEAIRQSKARTLLQNPAAGPVVDGYNLLGDPGLRLPDLGGAR